MYAEIAAAVQSAKALKDLVVAAQSLSNHNELVAAVSEVNSKLIEATAVALASQEKQSQLQAHVNELEKKLAEVEDWKKIIDRYQLHEFPTGALAFALKKDRAEGEPLHYICANCADRHHISRLQPDPGRNRLTCHPCNHSIYVKAKPPLPHTSNSGGSWMNL